MKIKFLGTGAADWRGPDERGEFRRFASTLFDGCLLIDANPSAIELIPDVHKVRDVFFTHSHRDHYDPDALKMLAPCRVYAHESWAGEISGEGLHVIPVKTGVPIATPSGHAVTPMPSNHSTDKPHEATLHYLVERNSLVILYATDGAWLLNRERAIIGDRALDAAIFDATVGDAANGDYRIFAHNSVDMVRLMVKTMVRTGILKPGAPVFLTHMARTLHGTQAEIERQLEKPLIACRDGMEVDII